MILKIQKDHHDGWLYRDGIKEIQTYKLYDPAQSSDQNTTFQVFRSLQELSDGVSRMWGATDDRYGDLGFSTEIWPDWPMNHSHEVTATCVRFVEQDESIGLAVLISATYLLGDDGKNIERLK